MQIAKLSLNLVRVLEMYTWSNEKPAMSSTEETKSELKGKQSR